MLATQMAAVHQSTMMMARRLNHVETIPQQDAAERALNKLARTFATQVQTLKKYRSKGEQVVRDGAGHRRGWRASDCRRGPDRGEGQR